MRNAKRLLTSRVRERDYIARFILPVIHVREREGKTVCSR